MSSVSSQSNSSQSQDDGENRGKTTEELNQVSSTAEKTTTNKDISSLDISKDNHQEEAEDNSKNDKNDYKQTPEVKKSKQIKKLKKKKGGKKADGKNDSNRESGEVISHKAKSILSRRSKRSRRSKLSRRSRRVEEFKIFLGGLPGDTEKGKISQSVKILQKTAVEFFLDFFRILGFLAIFSFFVALFGRFKTSYSHFLTFFRRYR